jgi:hypothetical protein
MEKALGSSRDLGDIEVLYALQTQIPFIAIYSLSFLLIHDKILDQSIPIG